MSHSCCAAPSFDILMLRGSFLSRLADVKSWSRDSVPNIADEIQAIMGESLVAHLKAHRDEAKAVEKSFFT